MAEDNKKKPSASRISEQQRYRYVGFDVHPGRIKDQFKSDTERKKLVERVREKRDHRSDLGALRDECTLLEDRVSFSDRIVLAASCVAMVAALFLPWYSAYNETIEESQVEAVAEVADSSVADDSLATDSAAFATEAATDEPGDTTGAAGQVDDGAGVDDGYSAAPKEEVIHGYVAKKKITKDYSRLTGLGSLAALGSVGGQVFSSGIVLILTGLIFLVLTLASLLLPAYTLFGLFGLKGTADQKALKLKSILRLNWVPVLVFTVALAASFVGGDYSFDAPALYHSLGDSYGPGAFMESLSWGVFVTLGASIMLAVKGIEI
ncbi:MAG: hypothetical protein OEV49_01890 [candidate division Zixibacteria bacterium]|nr:hypothetical protein [candidate division Zixibacteria bacterium]MDH3938743.1 hypothetical protein [candidate division Zixibacteria bacterium]MDH4033317.1 hypothetical protein [candidate division Zixibacteria bacterium]